MVQSIWSMKCTYCNGRCSKAGKQANGTQKYQCWVCKKYQQGDYVKKAWLPTTNTAVIAHVKEGCGIWNTARLLKISKTTVIARIKAIAAKIIPPKIDRQGLEFEVDELHTFIGKKSVERYVCYAICRATRTVVDFVTGPRTKHNLGKLTSKLMALMPRRIHTDGLNVYPTLIPAEVHKAGKWGTLAIERNNLTLRINMKRLARRSICFSRSVEMLESCLRIWFWG
jgi:insertion element IS1 protein InsB